jgi:hypothetical protein
MDASTDTPKARKALAIRNPICCPVGLGSIDQFGVKVRQPRKNWGKTMSPMSAGQQSQSTEAMEATVFQGQAHPIPV